MRSKIRRKYYETRKWFLILGAIILSPIFLYLMHAKNARSRSPDRGRGRLAKYECAHTNKQLRILVIPNITRIGDLVCATPVFRAIKEKYPDCHLAVLTQNKNVGIVKNNPRIDEIIDFKSSDLVSRVLGEVRRRGFNWSINLVGTAYGSLVSFFGLIPNRVTLTRAGRPLTEILTDWLNNYKFFYQDHTYLPSFYTKLLEPLGIEPVREREEIKEVYTTKAGDEKVGSWMLEKGIKDSDKLVGISITAGNKIKEWGDENFKKVAKYLVQKHNAKVIFLGGKDDEPRINKPINQSTNKHAFIKAVDFSVEELPSLIKRLNLYIAVDTGPIYIAHALKIPLIDICGPCDPREQPPKDERSIQVLPDGSLEPSSFVLKRAGRKEEHKRALGNTKVEGILRAVDKLILPGL